METLIAIASINAFFFSIVTFGRHNRTGADNLLAALFIILGLSFGTVYLSYLLNLPVLQVFVWNIGLLIAPLLYLYTYALIDRNIELRKKIIRNLLLFVMSFVYIQWVIIFSTESEIRTLFNSDLQDTNVLFVFFTLAEIFIVPFYIILIFRLLKKHNKNIRLFYSNLTDLDLRWLRVLLIGILFIWLILISFYYIIAIDEELRPKYGFGIASVFIFYLGYFATKQKPIYDAGIAKQNGNKKYSKSEMKKDEIDSLNSRLVELLENEKPYLDPEISLNNLANTLEVSPHNLSQLINSKFDMNFFELINKYRVDEFVNKIENGENKKLTLISIAYDCGFNSKSTFNRVFKNATGQTPTSFLKEYEN